MKSCFFDIFKKIETINKNKTDTHECQSTLPFKIIGKNGDPISVLGISRGNFFESKFFTVISINNKTNCALLEVLLCKNGELFRTQACVLYDLSSIVGIEIVSIPVSDCLFKSHVTNEDICLPFHLSNTDSPQIIWSTIQKKIENTATINVNYEGKDPALNLKLNTKDKAISLNILKGQMKSITASNLVSVEVSTPDDFVIGTIEIQLNQFEKKKILF